MQLLVALAVTAAAGCHASPAAGADRPTCANVAGHVEALLPEGEDHGAHRHEVREVLAAHCTADRWATDVLACMLDERDLHAGHHCQDQLTAEQRTAFNRDLAAIDAPRPKLDAHDLLPAECEAYNDAIKAAMTCDKIPIEAREALTAAFEQFSAAWPGLPPEARQQLAVACQAGGDTVRQMLAACASP